MIEPQGISPYHQQGFTPHHVGLHDTSYSAPGNTYLGDVSRGGLTCVLEGIANIDTTRGHGTHVSSIAAGTGAALAGKHKGVAVGASLVGVGLGEVLFIVSALGGFDWVLANRARYGIRVISNSWGTEGSFSADDPINVASKIAHDAGLVVVFAAGKPGRQPIL